MGFFEKITELFQDRFGKMTNEEKRRVALICTAVFVVILTLSVILSMRNSGEADIDELPSGPESLAFNRAIPAEELFLPEEPDYIPGVLLERERRSSWNEEDAGEYWQDPLRFGEEQWREKISAVIDDFLERVP